MIIGRVRMLQPLVSVVRATKQNFDVFAEQHNEGNSTAHVS